MPTPNLVMLYVADPLRSAPFYEKLLGQKPVASFPTYVAFAFDNGFNLGLWSTTAPNFVSAGTGNRSELAFMIDDDATVDRMHDDWVAASATIEQAPMKAVFGRTFVALDPDGHRIRVISPNK